MPERTARPSSAADRPPVLRPARPDDHADIRQLFHATILAGSPLPAELTGASRCLQRYARLCLDPYLEDGLAIVAERDGRVVGYLLGSLDESGHRRRQVRLAVWWALFAGGGIATGRLRGPARRFVVLRVLDGVDGWRHGPRPPFPAHAHVNLARTARAGGVGRRLTDIMDAAVAAAGLPGWYGEMTVPEGRSLAAVQRAGATVVHRQTNRTFSWLLERPVERVTVARRLHAVRPPDHAGPAVPA